MAATYRLVVSTVNHYSSVVIDRRFEQAIHYCTGTCHTITHGLDCIVVHHSVCADLLHIPVSQFKDADLDSIFLPHENGFSLAEGDYPHQALIGIPRVKKGSTFQNTCNLKDIAGEAISFASGKIKEFSLEKLKNSNHAAYKKGRKVKSDSFNRRSVDFDLLCGHYNNDGNSPTFGLLRSSSVEEKSLAHRNSLDTNLTSMFLQNFSEDLVTQILEKHKIDQFSSGTDIKMCLDILLKCSEDLKKCTDIIKQCIKKKSGTNINEGSGNDAISSSETVYMTVMTRLASYLKKLPFEFMQSGNNDAIDLTELVSNMPSLQLTPFSPIFGTEQPPKYEDVVQLSASDSDSAQFQTTEKQDDKHNSRKTDTVKSIPDNSTNSLPNLAIDDTKALKNIPLQSQSLTMKTLENVSSGDLVETLYIEEELDGEKVSGKGQRTENGPNQELLKVNEERAEFSDCSTHLKKCPISMQNEIGKIFEKPVVNLPEEVLKSKVPKVEEGDHRDFMNPNSQKEIDKLLMDLESFSQKMETSLREPLTKSKISNSLNSNSPLTSQMPVDVEHNSKVSSPVEKVSPSCLTRIIETNGHKIEEEDRALLLRILESIEDFAQELVECKSGRGSLSQEKEMMQILQETLTASSQTNLSVCRSPVGDKPKDTTSVVLIQQTPEVIKIQNKPGKKPGTPLPPPATVPSSTQPVSPIPHVNNASTPLSKNIPQFYFPEGLPDTCSNHEQTLSRIETAFMDIEDQKADIYEMGKIAKVCGCPLYWKAPMFRAAGGESTGFVSAQSFIAMWRKLLNSHHDDASKFICLLAKPSCSFLEQEDFIPLLQDVVDTHPGLTFLKDAPEFHSRYITTVIQRIFYTVNRSWSGKITSTEIRKSNFLQTLALLEEEEDINQITDYFSYEHFYVIYCKFWELDCDHDLYISQADLSHYNDQASSNRIIERIFSGAVTRGKTVQKEGRMSYADFVWFLISEEDKRNPTSIEYWFRCMDVDGDGVLSMYELEYFYEEQCERMEAMGIEPLPFHDLLCQMLDLVKPASDGKITLRDLKRCRMAHIFYDTFFNLEKYLDHEQRDPFAVQKDVENDGPEPSDWDRFAAEEYETLVAEESAQAQFQEGSFEDYETEESSPLSEFGNKGNKIVTSSLSEKCGKLQSVDEE
ncbi:serine/threonine-protein phosphatase 2A regulatory subunit B'' subunit alpha isoform X1 [Talpa occidentalis]|uniref:serine/threonine-protein phosphatase 2A regulatory subunit B'' subunit alpha isoform X1 n=2 Tax=Talpa occidentalis TaxID=50954 RepID=UPI00188E171E|nr:serine/threonine-protein phosphatase 2A regulatory subunit B'' subunit alpha isoform X1 [Talpa occidentalis]XP_054556783.1 serine/threonine-protein phosphatase 2A regulatory subunit B'' subunit alpha isoform X1 [Talpa occidentalis]XP_054556784.1 serine/threonine-protein phosphatase 2A regulatory subunit B'' subunit alpha isoform X1 [Talpa occidentalis]XP_054556785.1 serine/threonine-protein phosphatase 2A regulatory subunit B'' subunit alpha isoform X1 [Talpa occidentalis]